MTIHSETEKPNEFAQRISVGQHSLLSDMSEAEGGHDLGPTAHDYFDAALAACKTLTATWYAKKNGLALERVEVDVERDDKEERAGKYVLKVKLTYHGNLTDQDRARIHAAVARCPVHKLMTTTDVVIETAPL